MDGCGNGSAYGAITEEFMKPLKQAAQGEVDKMFVKSVIGATELGAGFPTTEANRFVDAMWRRPEGKDASPLDYVLGRTKK